MSNGIKTVLLLGALTGLIIFIGGMVGGKHGMVIAFVLAAVMNFGSYWFSDKIVLAMYRAQPVTEAEAPDLLRLVNQLTMQAGLPMPKVYILPQPEPNAFATGRNPAHAAVAVTQGLLQLMNRDELSGVLAHELAHVRNRDILISSIAATMAGAIMMLASMARWAAIFGGLGRSNDNERGGGIIEFVVMAVLAPFAALLIQMAISRSREYLADATGAQIAGNPFGLAAALQKLGSASSRRPMQNANPATAHMFIVNPFAGKSLMKLFSTHPPLEERIHRLTTIG